MRNDPSQRSARVRVLERSSNSNPLRALLPFSLLLVAALLLIGCGPRTEETATQGRQVIPDTSAGGGAAPGGASQPGAATSPDGAGTTGDATSQGGIFEDTLRVTETAKSFTLPRIDGQGQYSFQPGVAGQNAKATVVLFLSTRCEASATKVDRLRELYGRYGRTEVEFVAINSMPEETAAEVGALAQDLPFPVLRDADASVARMYGVDQVPTAFVIDEAGMIHYMGGVRTPFNERQTVALPDLANAIEAVTENMPVMQRETPVEGCPIQTEDVAKR